MFKQALLISLLVVGVCGQQSNETSTATTASTTSAAVANITTIGLTPQLMRLLDDPVETDETESIFPFEKMNVVAFPRINIEATSELSTPSPEDSLKVEKQKLETFLHHIAANSESFTPSKQSYGSIGKFHDEEMETQQPSSLLNGWIFFDCNTTGQ
uniref:Uncharacterized protein n=1 Tax=Ditylenchus dipsaci TaxID=166011 RepID=A0A915D5S6_9BILA